MKTPPKRLAHENNPAMKMIHEALADWPKGAGADDLAKVVGLSRERTIELCRELRRSGAVLMVRHGMKNVFCLPRHEPAVREAAAQAALQARQAWNRVIRERSDRPRPLKLNVPLLEDDSPDPLLTMNRVYYGPDESANRTRPETTAPNSIFNLAARMQS